jgi:hypothetical protein
MLFGVVERTLLGGFMYRVENVVIAAVSIVVLLVLKFPNVLFATAVSRFIFGCAVIAAIGLVFWMYFTDSGKAFVRNHNRKQQETLTAESELFAQGESLLRKVPFDYLMNKFRNLSTFAEVAEWDKEAEVAIAEIVETIKLLDTVVLQHSNVNTLTQTKFKQKYQEILENMAVKLQESIDFTPNNSDEQKALIKELSFAKKELQLQKKDVTSTMKTVNERSRSKSVRAGNFLGIYNSKIAASERRNIRYQRDAQLRPNEAKKAAIERQILQIEKDILSVKRFTK